MPPFCFARMRPDDILILESLGWRSLGIEIPEPTKIHPKFGAAESRLWDMPFVLTPLKIILTVCRTVA